MTRYPQVHAIVDEWMTCPTVLCRVYQVCYLDGGHGSDRIWCIFPVENPVDGTRLLVAGGSNSVSCWDAGAPLMTLRSAVKTG
jgi:hypothetical protein